MANTPVRRCAIYTRKSSEEGSEQDYNSLHAQRAGAGIWPSRFDPATTLTIRRRVRRPDQRNLGLRELVKYRNAFVLETRVS